MRLARSLAGVAAFLAAGGVAFGAATWMVNRIENATGSAIGAQLQDEGHDWAMVETDGQRVTLTGTAQTEASRFRALSIAGTVVDPARVIDMMTVEAPSALEPPRFSMELLRNDDGVSLIGLVPMSFGRDRVMDRIARIDERMPVADMLESADHPVPDGWADAVAFGLEAVALLPRSKVSIAPRRVAVTAISDSPEQRRQLETRLARSVPQGIRLVLDISSPRPVITPFTMRFVIDDRGARFDACAADTEAARTRILAAGVEAGATGQTACPIGLGVPSPQWGAAAAESIAALAQLGQGTVTMSDADVSLIVPHQVAAETFDGVAARLDNALPDVFSLAAVRLEAPADETSVAPPEFTATLSDDGQVMLRGRITDAATRDAVQSFARARFGSGTVATAVRLDPDLPEGWPHRVLTGLEVLAELHEGNVQVRADRIELQGRSGNLDSTDIVTRTLSDKLGRGQVFRISVDYDEALDPIASLPTPERCVSDIDEILAERQIGFDPGSARIDSDTGATLDRIATVLRDCGELPLEIGGHTDSQGRAEMNLALSQRRAESVLEALLSRRVLVGQMTAVGYGQEQPVADNSTAAGREANRRIEFRLLLDEDPETAEGTEGFDTALYPQRDPELEATLEIPVNMAEDDTARPAERPARD